jgi:hypothetical protein
MNNTSVFNALSHTYSLANHLLRREMDRRVKPGDDGGERDQIDRKMR